MRRSFHLAATWVGASVLSAGCNEATTSAPCPDGQRACDDACVDTASDALNCGACGRVCEEGSCCFSGACTRPGHLRRRRTGHGVEIIDGLIYAVGGWDGDLNLAPIEVYDPIVNEARDSGVALPTPRRFLGVVADHRRIIAAGGGYESFTTVTTVEVYSPDEGLGILPDMKTGRADFSFAADHDGVLYAIWGAGDSGSEPPREGMDVLVPGAATWSVVGTGDALARQGARAVTATDGRIYLLGGSLHWPASGLTDVDVFEPATGTWSKAPELALPSSWGAATLGIDGRIYLFGGFDAHGDNTRSAQVYDPAGGGAWTQIADLPDVRADTEAVTTADGRIWILGGGVSGTYFVDTVFVYDPVHDAWCE